MNNETAVFAGSFDPFTRGHREIAERAAGLFGKVVIAVADLGENKRMMLDLATRTRIAELSTDGLRNTEVVSFCGLLVDFMKKLGANVLVRGIRSVTDFEYERELFAAYRAMYPQFEACYLMAYPESTHISSSRVRELVALGGDCGPYLCRGAEELVYKAVGRERDDGK